MNAIQPRLLKQRARQILQEQTGDFRKLVVLHSAVSFGVLILLMLVDLLLDHAISQTGGLADMGTRSVLKTVSSGLYTAANLVLPFWEIGLIYTAIRSARGQDQNFSMLTAGFQRFGPVLRYLLLQVGIAILTAIACSNALMFFSFLIPIPQSLENFLITADPAALADPEAMLAQLPVDAMLQYMLPVMLLFSALYLGVTIHLQYRFRMGQYLLMDENGCGAMAALGQSNQLTRGNKWNLFKLDLSFWWYYALTLALALVAELPTFLSLLQIPLPAGSSLLFYLLYVLGSLGLLWIAGAYMQTTYACAYQQLITPAAPEQ